MFGADGFVLICLYFCVVVLVVKEKEKQSVVQVVVVYSLDRKAEVVKIDEDPVTDVRSLPVTIWVS